MPLEFPLIFDGMELVQRYGDEIREETGLPEFSRNAYDHYTNPIMNDIKGLERWEGETREYNRRAGKLKMQAGIGNY